MKKIIRNNIKIVIAFVIGIILAGTGVYAATVIAGTSITYSNTTSGLTSTNIQGAIDELVEKINSNYVAAYLYDASSCPTGIESTCVKTDCYKTKVANSCKAGTIIKYRVNDMEEVLFNVMFDEGNTMTMHSVYNIDKYESTTMWAKQVVIGTDPKTKRDIYGDGPVTDGPQYVLEALEKATANWTNVNNQTYTLGTTNFSGKGSNTGCATSTFSECNYNFYTLPERTAKARLITTYEIKSLDYASWLNGGTVYNHDINDFWLPQTVGDTSVGVMETNSYGSNVQIMQYSNTNGDNIVGMRAVVVVNK